MQLNWYTCQLKCLFTAITSSAHAVFHCEVWSEIITAIRYFFSSCVLLTFFFIIFFFFYILTKKTHFCHHTWLLVGIIGRLVRFVLLNIVNKTSCKEKKNTEKKKSQCKVIWLCSSALRQDTEATCASKSYLIRCG